MKARFYKRTFQFKFPAGTSRGILREKYAWFIELWNEDQPDTVGVGECSIIPGLSPDYTNDSEYEARLDELCASLDGSHLDSWPSIQFGWEMALLDLKSGGKQHFFDNEFRTGKRKLPINGLVWMGNETFMQQQVDEKIEAGFSTIKMKIGAIDLEAELSILDSIRRRFNAREITLRVDANGAFSPQEAPHVLQKLAELDIHSIEQPIQAGQWDAMKEICRSTPTPVALDEELIGIHDSEEKERLLDTIQPQFIILKPSLHGGIKGTQEWIKLAEERTIDWWITSALESNVGLNALCQLTAEYQNNLPQGLGTGSLYVDNLPSDLVVKNGHIYLEK